MTNISREFVPEEACKHSKSSTPLGRLVQVEDAVELVVFLLSDNSVMISGTNYVRRGLHVSTTIIVMSSDM